MLEVNEKKLRQQDDLINKRYSDRLKVFGDEARTLGWDSELNQIFRFEMATRFFSFHGLSVLDIGCGLAHFRTFLNKKNIAVKSFSGFDINRELLEICKIKYPEDQFVLGNLLTDKSLAPCFDVVTMFGVLNLKLEHLDNHAFAAEMIAKAFSLTKNSLIVDVLSTRKESTYDSENFVNYYEPQWILNLALELTPYVTLAHDYKSIPQREMMLVLRKGPVCDV